MKIDKNSAGKICEWPVINNANSSNAMACGGHQPTPVDCIDSLDGDTCELINGVTQHSY